MQMGEVGGPSMDPIVDSEHGLDMDASFWQQLKATVVRNILRKKRNKRQAFREIFNPVLYMCIIIILKLVIPTPNFPAIETPQGTSSVSNPSPASGVFVGPTPVGIVPNNTETRQFMDNHVLKLPQLKSLEAHYYENTESLEADREKLKLGIDFRSLKTELNYKLRTDDSYRLPSTTERDNDGTQCRTTSENSHTLNGEVYRCGPTNYFFSGFMTLQSAIDFSWIKWQSQNFSVPKEITLQLVPKKSQVSGSMYALRSIIPLYLAIAMSQFVPPMLTVVVQEKEKKIKESMRMVGLRSSVFWLSWFIIYSGMIFIVCLAGSIIMHFVILEQKSNFFLLLILMFEFGLSLIMFAFVLTTLFSKAKTAAVVGALSTTLVSFLYYLQIYLTNIPSYANWLLGLISPPAMTMAIDKMMADVSTDSEIEYWDNSSGLPIGGSIIMLFVDIILYGLLAFWLDQIMPTEYGTRRHPLFFLQINFWRAPKANKTLQRTLSRSVSRNDKDFEFEGPDIEKIPDDLVDTETMVISNIKKTFTAWKKPPVHAVRGISMKIYPNEITAILGHNGAGKSTLFNMLTGMTSPSSGTANICGYDITDQNQMEEIRKMTGICPQHDVLFDELTIKEHLEFFARIRGMPEASIPNAVTEIIKDVDLVEKTDIPSKSLSGGQKRKLSVGIALIGDPKVIFLDEPTAGVDPYSRRHLWTLLKQKKEGKMILLTTHFMDEADLLADRKAIISHGTLRCYGSSLFLKSRFGLGYHLTMVLKQEAQLNKIADLIASHIPEAKRARLFGKELSYVLPRQNVPEFPQLFGAIETDIKENGSLGIDSYGTSMPTLEEVFLRLGDEVEDTSETSSQSQKEPNEILYGATDDTEKIVGYEFEKVKTEKSSWQTFKALAKIRLLNKMREPGLLFVQNIMPIAYLTLGIYITSLSSQSSNEPTQLDISSKTVYPRDNSDGFFYGFQNNTDSTLPDFVENATRHITSIDNTVNYTGLIDYGHLFTIFNFFSNTEDGLNVTLIGNDKKSHILPIALNDLSNTVAKSQGLGANITLSSEPFKRSESLPAQFDGASFGGSIFFGLNYVLFVMGVAIEFIYDREVKAKNQLRVNGLGYYMYFGSFYAVLLIQLIILYVAILVISQAFNLHAITMTPAYITFALLYFIFPFPAILFSTTVSYPFNKTESSNALFGLGMLMGLLPFILVFMLKSLQVGGGTPGDVLHILFSFISPLYIPFGIFTVLNLKYWKCYGEGILEHEDKCDKLNFGDYIGDPDIYSLFLACVFHLVLWFVLLKIVDVVKDGGKASSAFSFTQKMFGSKVTKALPASEEGSEFAVSNPDEDVLIEKEAVHEYFNQNGSDSAVAVKDVGKIYKASQSMKKMKGCRKRGKESTEQKSKLAVKSVSFGVPNGQVFGLLGPNGAGKTTTMKMITAEENPSRGQIKIGPHEIKSNDSEGFEYLGYCPQFDAVWRKITIREHLEAYAAIRGLPPSNIPRLIDQIMSGLRIEEHAKKQADDCSGGTKRKLSYAMAMLGDPRIVLLDEPSCGMDPQSKRFVWDTILASFKGNRGAILTTHAMEEADALCSRVGIMVKGELRCLGSTQHLKNKYGGGYTLDLKCGSDLSTDWENLQSAVEEIFGKDKVAIYESFSDRRTYSVSQEGVKSLMKVFNSLEKLKSDYDVEEYSFGQTTLEQVFIKFAKEQDLEEE